VIQLYKTTHSVEGGIPSVWWDTTREDADATLQTFWDNCLTLAERGNAQQVLEQGVLCIPERYHYKRLALITDVLNGVYKQVIVLRVRLQGKQITAYERADSLNSGLSDMVRVEIPSYPTPQYGEYYTTLRNNPALYELCARAKTKRLWFDICERVGFNAPRHIQRWLYTAVTGRVK
jgi:hypothetical protein